MGVGLASAMPVMLRDFAIVSGGLGPAANPNRRDLAGNIVRRCEVPTPKAMLEAVAVPDDATNDFA